MKLLFATSLLLQDSSFYPGQLFSLKCAHWARTQYQAPGAVDYTSAAVFFITGKYKQHFHNEQMNQSFQQLLVAVLGSLSSQSSNNNSLSVQSILGKDVESQIVPCDNNVTLPGNKSNKILAVMDHVFQVALNSLQVDFQSLLNKRKPLAAWKRRHQFKNFRFALENGVQ